MDDNNAGRSRRKFLEDVSILAGSAVAGTLVPALPAFAQAKSNASGTVRVWGEPGPYGGVAVDGMNEWASKFAPKLKFQIESLSWDSVYVKLMTDLAARRPANCISVESPIAMQLMAQGLLEPLDDVVKQVGRDRLIEGAKWEYWGAWKGKQYVLPAHHQPHLLLVRQDIVDELGLGDPDKWDWNDLLKAAQTITEKKKDMAGISIALGRNLCTDYHFAALLHAAGGRMFDASRQYEVVFDSPQTVEALEFVKALQPYMPKGAVGNGFLEVVDSVVTGKAAMAFYWGRPYGRAWTRTRRSSRSSRPTTTRATRRRATARTGTTSRAGASRRTTIRTSRR
jgi:ABC-type glycerol-3-phosphate transport system substrate-binding protein